MISLDVANALLDRYSDEYSFTNLKLNKLVYYAQVESLILTGEPLFDDAIEAWEYGPVEPRVYHAFKRYGRLPIAAPSGQYRMSEKGWSVLSSMMDKYSDYTAFDLVTLSHDSDGAWARVFDPGRDALIRIQDILESGDMTRPKKEGAFAKSIRHVEQTWPNALRMLGDA